MFTATLTGAQQVPAVVSGGTGTGTVLLNAAETQITVNLNFTGLSSAASAAHIHGPAAAGANAGVLFDFAAVVPAATSGSIPAQTFAITPAQVAELKAGLYYFNIHTGNFSGGEIRGQIGLAAVQHTTTLTGAQEVPAVSSPGTGTGMVALNAAESLLIVNLSFADLTSSPIAADIHGPAVPGFNAGVVFDFPVIFSGLTTDSTPQQTFAITPSQVADLKNGLYYIDIHTVTHTLGEIRGQIGVPAITTQPVNQSVPAGTNATFTVAASGAPAPTYQWQISVGGPSFTNLTNAPPYSGVTTPTLTITAASAGLSGYQYRAVATNSAGAATSDAATLTVTLAGPQAPTGLAATPAGFTRIGLTWTASGGATSYNVKRSTAPGAETTLATGVTATSYTDATAVKGQPYYYVVSAVNGGGESPNSAEVAAATPARLAPLDFDGDGKSDLTYVRPSTFNWNTLQTHAAFTTSTSVQWGLPGDVAVPGDYDGDGVIDPAVYRPSSGTWFVTGSSIGGALLFAIAQGVSADIPVPGDYDGDGKTDPALYRRSDSRWYVLTSSTGYATQTVTQWGLDGDVPAAGDFDGDGLTDPAVYRPSNGTWYALQSSAGLPYTTFVTYVFGLSTDLPVQGDYDGDGKADPAVYRPSSRTWLHLMSSASYAAAAPVQWGLFGDLAVPADYDGDGKIDAAIYRPSSGTWFARLSSTAAAQVVAWGESQAVPLPIVSAPPRSDARRLSDVDGDGLADLTVFRPASGQWFTLTSSSNYSSNLITQWGLSTDTPVPGDYDGDGKADRAVFRPSSGMWYVLTSSSNYTTSFTAQWGLDTDRPVPGDYDGDGKTDPAIYRPSTGAWYILRSSSSYTTSLVIQWGLSTDTPVANDYDGDAKTDPAVYRPSTGTWYVLNSSSGYTTSTAIQWGLPDDIAVPGDYDGDSKGDLAVCRPSTGQWFLLFSAANFTTSQVVQWGLPNDLVVPLDYDGDGKTDPAVWRPSTGVWYILRSNSGYTASFTPRQWGLSTDVPILKR
jgi:hypothetical protein